MGVKGLRVKGLNLKKKSAVNLHFMIDIFLYCTSLSALEFIDTEHRRLTSFDTKWQSKSRSTLTPL